MGLKVKPNIPESPRARRIRKAVQVTGTQIMPKLCLTNYWCMLLVPAVAIILEFVNHFRYGAELGAARLLFKCVQSVMIIWLFFAVILIAASAIQLYRLNKGHIETRYVAREVGDDTDPFEPVDNPQPKYRKYIKIALIGSAAVIVLFVAVKLILGY